MVVDKYYLRYAAAVLAFQFSFYQTVTATQFLKAKGGGH